MQLDVHANFASMVNAQAESTMAVIVNVLDMNDNKPVFTQDPYVAEVAEASAKGNDRGNQNHFHRMCRLAI